MNRGDTTTLGVVILAAGKATRMKSDLNKVLHAVAGRPILSYVLDTAKSLKPVKIVVVVGHQGEQVKEAFMADASISWAWQKNMRGTGDAVQAAASEFAGYQGSVLVMVGDAPGIRAETMRSLVDLHTASQHTITMLTANVEDPTGYGRMVLGSNELVDRIVEQKDATDEERRIREINSGIGIYDSEFLFSSLPKLQPNNQQGEFYLTDVVAMARSEGKNVGRYVVEDPNEILGINDANDLVFVSRLFEERKRG